MKTFLRILLWVVLAVLVSVVAVVAYYSWRVHQWFTGTDPKSRAFWAQLETVRTALPGDAGFLALSGCDLYRRAPEATTWDSVSLPFGPGEYPRFMTVCTRASITLEDGAAVVSICAQAIGAGGGCGRAGTFRSRDGTTWERLSP